MDQQDKENKTWIQAEFNRNFPASIGQDDWCEPIEHGEKMNGNILFEIAKDTSFEEDDFHVAFLIKNNDRYGVLPRGSGFMKTVKEVHNYIDKVVSEERSKQKWR